MTFSVDKINYEVKTPTTVVIISSPGASGDIFIPRFVIHQRRKFLITSISPQAFAHNNNIQSFKFADDSEISTIEQEAFSDSSIIEFVIPPNLTQIGPRSFFSCKNLGSVTFSDSSKLEIIDALSFQMTGLISINVPSHVRQIGVNAFNHCEKLSSVNFSEDSELTFIGDSAFSFCSQLQEITIPSKVQSIGSSTFSYCARLKSVTFTKNSELNSMGVGVFAGTSLERISIPLSVTDIEKYFGSCKKVTTLEFFTTEFTINRQILELAPNLNQLVLPNSKKVTVEKGTGKFTIFVRRDVCLNGPGKSDHIIEYIDRLSRPSSTIMNKKSAVINGPQSSPIKATDTRRVILKNAGSSIATLKTEPKFADKEATSYHEKVQSLTEKVEELQKQLKAKNRELRDLQIELREEKENHKNTQKKLIELNKKIGNNNKSDKSKQKNEIQVLSVDDINQYQKLKKIGRGATSKVIKIQRPEVLALKILNIEICTTDKKSDKRKEADDDFDDDDFDGSGDYDDDEDFEIDFQKVRRFFNEYEILSQIDHPYIIKTFGFCYGDKKHAPSILLEYCPYNLKDLVKRKKVNDNDLVRIIYEISIAMKHVHNLGIIHRDLKPENILLDSNKRVKLSDFGISKLTTPEMQTSSYTQGIGTLQFMAPELLKNKGKYCNKVDVYAFGVVVFFVLTGGNLPNIDIVAVGNGEKAKIPRGVNKFSRGLINSCWSFSPDDRPSFEEISELISMNHYELIDGVSEKEIVAKLQ